MQAIAATGHWQQQQRWRLAAESSEGERRSTQHHDRRSRRAWANKFCLCYDIERAACSGGAAYRNLPQKRCFVMAPCMAAAPSHMRAMHTHTQTRTSGAGGEGRALPANRLHLARCSALRAVTATKRSAPSRQPPRGHVTRNPQEVTSARNMENAKADARNEQTWRSIWNAHCASTELGIACVKQC